MSEMSGEYEPATGDERQTPEVGASHKLLDVRYMDVLLHAHCPRLEMHLGTYRVVGARVRRAKPGKRCLIEYRLVCEQSQSIDHEFTILGKVRFKGLDERTPVLMDVLEQEGWGAHSPFRVPRVLGVLPAVNMWLQELVDGRVHAPDNPEFVERQERTAAALCALHRESIRVLRQHTIAKEFRVLENLYAELMSSDFAQPVSIRDSLVEVQKRYRRVLGQMSDLQASLVHRDFYFEQVLHTSNDQVVMLDLDEVCLGDPAMDVGNYLGHLVEYFIRSPAAQVFCKRGMDEFAMACVSRQSNLRTVSNWTFLTLARLLPLSQRIEGRGHTGVALLDLLLGHTPWSTLTGLIDCRLGATGESPAIPTQTRLHV